MSRAGQEVAAAVLMQVCGACVLPAASIERSRRPPVNRKVFLRSRMADSTQ